MILIILIWFLVLLPPALRAAVEELAKWVGDRGFSEIVGNVSGALATLDENVDAVRQGIAELVAASVR
ncbi:hypothetical protein D3C77_324990 [compost metagenome]